MKKPEIIRLSEASRIIGVSENIFRRKHMENLRPSQLWDGGPFLFYRDEVEQYKMDVV
jgi:hypothetical protein